MSCTTRDSSFHNLFNMDPEPVIIQLESTRSTNSYAADLLRGNRAGEGTVIAARYQSEGRGQSQNIWESEQDMNLLFSIILCPDRIKPEDQFILSMAVSLAIKDFLIRHIGSVKIKWPNDIYIGSDKIAGILIENAIAGDRILHTIAGVGLNVNQVAFLSDAPNPVSMKMVTGLDYDTDIILREIVEAILARYRQATDGGRADVMHEYHSSLWLMGESHRFRSKGVEFTGTIIGTDSRGCLLVKCEDGSIRYYAFKEVEYLK
jgi:BirA family transcriptional regulator, biotin operon repressor / biotin---[acetyl-CoA-carboxylase] ligase